MKSRIKTDTLILVISIIVTVPIFFIRKLYPVNLFWDNIFDVIGIILILKGNLIRMMARGHKRTNSQQGEMLVMTGLYSIVRNPMYLGSFLVGTGFILLLWPFWVLFIFALIFYLRFNRQMLKEEVLLKRNFGKKYEEYCQKTPRFFPSIQNILRIESKKYLDLKEAFSTKEKWGLLTWIALAFVLEIIQEKFVFQSFSISSAGIVFLSAILLYGILLSLKNKLG